MMDTAPEIVQRYRDMLFARSPADRFIMGTLMFDTARTMVLASFPSDLPPDELRRRLFARLYGDELPADRIPQALRNASHGFGPPR